MRTIHQWIEANWTVALSPVPFGGGSYADEITGLKGAALKKAVSSAFRRWVLCGPAEAVRSVMSTSDESPVPFGGGSYADLRTGASSLN